MNIDQFVAKYNGVHIDEDGYYGAQCWDVSARYAREVIGCPSFPTGSGGAEGLFRIFANPIPQYFDKIANNTADPNQIPAKGDIIVWNSSFSPPWGHTAVVISANSAGVTVLEQNGNNPGGAAYIKTRGWTGVSGWLRPKGVNNVDRKIDGSADDVAMLRIAHSEAGGWNLHEVHAGKNDKLFVDTYRGRTVRDLLWAQWNNGVAWRDRRERALAFLDSGTKQLAESNALITSLRQQIEDLKKNPTKEEVDKLLVQLKESETKAMEIQKKFEEQTAKDKATENAVIAWLKAIFRIGTK